MKSRSYSDEAAIEAIKTSPSFRQIFHKLGIKNNAGGNYLTIRKIIDKYKIDTSHFTGQGHLKGGEPSNAIPLEKVLKKGIRANSCLKRRLIKNGLLKEECYECGIGPIWREKKLTLELEHNDGDTYNDLIENLRLLCPNCHSQTPTFRKRKCDL